MSDEDAASSVPLQLPFAPILSRLMGIQQFHLLGHFRSQRLCSFCSVPRIPTSGEVQFSEHAQRIHFVFSHNQIFRYDSEHAQSDGKSVYRGLLVWELPRGRDFTLGADQKEHSPWGQEYFLVRKNNTILQ